MSHDDDKTPRSVIALIREIQQGALAPKTLSVEDRQRCVEHLTGEGYSVVEIGEILQVSERTVARDRSTTREANRLERDPRFVAEAVGQMVGQAERCIQRIRRVTRDREVDASTRIDGERVCWSITRQLVELLQSLGYLPTAPQQIIGDVTHYVEGVPPFSEMGDELSRLEIIFDQAGVDQDLYAQFSVLADEVNRGAAIEHMRLLESQAKIATDGANDEGPTA